MATLFTFLSIGKRKWEERTCLFHFKETSWKLQSVLLLTSPWPKLSHKKAEKYSLFPKWWCTNLKVGIFLLPSSYLPSLSLLSAHPLSSELCFMDPLLVLEQIRVPSNLMFFMCSSLDHSPPAHPTLLTYSVQFSRSVMSDSLLSHGLQHARPPCPSPTPGVYSNSCPLIESVMPSNHLILCHPFLLPPSSFPASGSFQMSQFFESGGQSIAVSASVLPMNIQDWSPLGWTGWISLQSKGLSRVFSNTTVQKHQFF